MFKDATEGTENRMFQFDKLALMPEVTNYIRAAGAKRLKASKVFYVARCFRNETTTGAERLREFTQIGVEILGDNPLDCCKVARRDAIKLFQTLDCEDPWVLEDGVKRGLNLYLEGGKTFEISSKDEEDAYQVLGGGTYEGGAGWALGLERLMLFLGR